MGRGSGGYNPANAAPSMLGPLSTNFTGSGTGESAPSPLDMSEFPSLSRGGSSGAAILADAMTVGGGHVGGRPGGTYGGLSHGWGGECLHLNLLYFFCMISYL